MALIERDLSRAQQRALAWLRRVGKATERNVNDAGHRRDTLDILVRDGFATTEVRRTPSYPFAYRLYYPTPDNREV